MKQDKKKVPKLRFSKFSDSWKQCVFSDLVEIRRGLTYKPSNVSKFGIRVLRSSNIDEDTFVLRDDDVFVDPSVVKIPLVKNGDILITSANGSSRLVGKHSIIRQLSEKSAVHGGFMLLASSQDPEFVNALMSAPWYEKFINTFIAGGNGAIGNLNKSDLNGQTVMVPSIEERRKIGSFFANLDSTITLQQRKLEALKKLKKGLLQKMFPKEGESVPELRFSGFSGEWQERKLGEIAKKITQKNTKLEYDEIFTNSAEYGIICQNDFFDHRVGSSENIGNYYVVAQNDFVYNPRISTSAPVGPINRNSLNRTGVMSPLYTVFRVIDVNEVFLEWYFKSTCWHAFMYFNGDSGARSDRFTLKNSIFFSMSLLIPTKEEQQKIGSFFTKFDRIISLHQQKYQKLLAIKKALLSKMFV